MSAGRIPSLLAILILAGVAAGWACAASAQDDEDEFDFPTTNFAEGARTASISSGDITATITLEKGVGGDDTLDYPVLHVLEKGQAVLNYTGAGSSLDFPAADASIAEIDPGNDTEEVYFTSYTGGAHCCSRVAVASKTDKGWSVVEVGEFDGDGNLLEDADGDGMAEMVTPDNRFLYRFDCYACSVAPLQILTIRNGALVDQSTDPRFRDTHQHWLEQIESDVDPSTKWKSMGFLAGWVATRIRLGEGTEAWRELNEHWDLAKDRGAAVCLNGDDVSKCARKNRKTLKFPERLKMFLDRNGYTF